MQILERIQTNDVPTLKGKSTKLHPPVVTRKDFVEIPKELDVSGMKVDMAIDVI